MATADELADLQRLADRKGQSLMRQAWCCGVGKFDRLENQTPAMLAAIRKRLETYPDVTHRDPNAPLKF